MIDFAYEMTVTLYDENDNPYVVHYWALTSGGTVPRLVTHRQQLC